MELTSSQKVIHRSEQVFNPNVPRQDYKFDVAGVLSPSHLSSVGILLQCMILNYHAEVWAIFH